MRTLLRLPKRATYADYLATQQNSESRLEDIDGVIVAMAGGSDEHNAIAGRLAGLSFNRLAGTAAITRPTSGSGSRRVGAGDTATDPSSAARQRIRRTTTRRPPNPVVIFEVLSPSS